MQIDLPENEPRPTEDDFTVDSPTMVKNFSLLCLNIERLKTLRGAIHKAFPAKR